MAQVAVGMGIRDRGGTVARPRSRQMLAMMIGCGLFFLLIGLALIVHSSQFVSTQAQLRADGQTIAADVLDAQTVRSTRRGTVTSTRHEVKYRFQPPGQSVVTSEWAEAPEEVVRAAVQARTIEVRYLPSDPSVNLPSASVGTESGASFGSIWRMLVGAAFALLGLGIFFLARKEPRAPRLSSGQPLMPGSAG